MEQPAETELAELASRRVHAPTEHKPTEATEPITTPRAMLTQWKEPFRKKYKGRSVMELKSLHGDVKQLKKMFRKNITESKVKNGQVIIMPQGKRPPLHQIPLPSNPAFPIHPTEINEIQADGTRTTTWVYIDPSAHPDYFDLMQEAAFLVGEIVAMGSHPMSKDASANIDLR